jgi:hypothetical protein
MAIYLITIWVLVFTVYYEIDRRRLIKRIKRLEADRVYKFIDSESFAFIFKRREEEDEG